MLTKPCDIWDGVPNSSGYGPHKEAWEAVNGPVPAGLDLDHTCRVRTCREPSHLEPVTRLENLLRGDTLIAAQVARTHCPQGHPYSGENLYIYRNMRSCKACRSARSSAQWAATKAAR